MTLQNGAGNDRDILNFARKENIIIGTSQHIQGQDLRQLGIWIRILIVQ